MSKTIAITGSLGGLKPAAAFCVLMEELDALGLRQNVIAYAGSSGSSIWAALAASGLTGASMSSALLNIKSKEQWEDWNWWSLGTWILRRFRGWTGLMKGNKIRQWLYDHMGHLTFRDCPSLHVTGYDINCECPVLFSADTTPDVEIVKAVRGSTAIPGAFKCETIRLSDGRDHGIWDGGITCAIPLLPVIQHQADVVIAIDASGATDPLVPGPWVSLEEKSPFEMLSGAAGAAGAVSSNLQWQLAVQQNPNIKVYHVQKGASMSNPAGTIPAAYQDAKSRMKAFVDWNLLT